MTHLRGSLGLVDDLNFANPTRGTTALSDTVNFTIQNESLPSVCQPKTPAQARTPALNSTLSPSLRLLNVVGITTLATMLSGGVFVSAVWSTNALADQDKAFRAPIESRLVGEDAAVHMQYTDIQQRRDAEQKKQESATAETDIATTTAVARDSEQADEAHELVTDKLVKIAPDKNGLQQQGSKAEQQTSEPKPLRAASIQDSGRVLDPYDAKFDTLPAQVTYKTESANEDLAAARRVIASKAIATNAIMHSDVRSLYGASLVGASRVSRFDKTQDLGGSVDSDAKRWESVTVDPGDTLVSVFLRAGIDPAYAIRIAESDRHSTLRRLRAGQRIELQTSNGGEFHAMRLSVSDGRQFVARYRDDTGIVVEDDDLIRQGTDENENEYEAFGFIQSSLYEAATNIGLHPSLIANLAKIFRYEIDFSMDLRRGDRFAVIYEDARDGVDKTKGGDILAAEFINNGERHRAIRYVDDDGEANFYTPDGYSLKRAFFRSPVEFTRITSSFSNRRFHPVLKQWKAHRGVDYAAAVGTPVLATADGVISHRAAMGAYGRTVTIRHNDSYETLYAHLSDYGRGQRIGDAVLQGDVIGYVGRSGNATGPHLHYEFRVNGRHRNPLTVISDHGPAERIADRLMPDFLDTVSIYSSKLDSLDAKIAQNRTETRQPDQS